MKQVLLSVFDANARRDERFAGINACLERIQAGLEWAEMIPSVGTLHCYSIPSGRVFLLMVFGIDAARGWEVYLPAEASGKIQPTITALEAWASVEPARAGGAS